MKSRNWEVNDRIKVKMIVYKVVKYSESGSGLILNNKV